MVRLWFNLVGVSLETVSYAEFEKIEIRVGKVTAVNDFPEARKPAYKLTIDFGDLGIKRSSAQITKHYMKDDLVGMRVMAVVNFAKKQIGPFMSECLTLGFADENGDVILAVPDKDVPLGSRLF
jgi:tRNA-binding protein